MALEVGYKSFYTINMEMCEAGFRGQAQIFLYY